MERAEELHKEIEGLEARLAHLEAEARRVEEGKVEESEKLDDQGDYAGGQKSQKLQPSAAVAYWKEIRETEKRLDEKRAALRAVERWAGAEPVRIDIVFDGPDEDA